MCDMLVLGHWVPTPQSAGGWWYILSHVSMVEIGRHNFICACGQLIAQNGVNR